MIWQARRVHHPEYCDALEAEAGRFMATVTEVDLSTPIPTCPEWAMSDLVGHVGLVYRWSSHHVRERSLARVPSSAMGADPPASGVVEWTGEGIAPMLETFRSHDPDDRVWGWGADRHARFWPRRMLFETLVHRADAELALGREPVVDPRLAADGIDEFLANLPHATYFVAGVGELRGSGESIALAATDADETWRIRLLPAGHVWDWGRGEATATVRGAVADLLLAVYGRRAVRDTARFEASGDVDLAERALGLMSL
jgi:uncharacterized protein (TIGR03083 family)